MPHARRQGNLLQEIPANLPEELVEILAEGSGNFRLERIVSRGHSSPDNFWYEQESTEWVALVFGSAVLRFEDRTVEMSPGDWLEIPPLARHRVECTSEGEDTVWLALHWE